MDYINYYLNGLFAGFAATSVSHPFYNMKNVLQVGGILTNEMKYSLRWLYGGFMRAAIGYSGEKMLVFGTSLFGENAVGTKNEHSQFRGLITTVSEQLAIDKQLGVRKFSLFHLYSGILPTIVRESVGFGVHFTVYNFLSNIFNKERETYKTALCGTGAVIVGWSTVTPVDRIKTLIQSGKFVWTEYRFVDSFVGFRYVMLRAIPFHVVSFCVMEFLNKKNLLSKILKDESINF